VLGTLLCQCAASAKRESFPNKVVRNGLTSFLLFIHELHVVELGCENSNAKKETKRFYFNSKLIFFYNYDYFKT